MKGCVQVYHSKPQCSDEGGPEEPLCNPRLSKAKSWGHTITEDFSAPCDHTAVVYMGSHSSNNALGDARHHYHSHVLAAVAQCHRNAACDLSDPVPHGNMTQILAKPRVRSIGSRKRPDGLLVRKLLIAMLLVVLTLYISNRHTLCLGFDTFEVIIIFHTNRHILWLRVHLRTVVVLWVVM